MGCCRHAGSGSDLAQRPLTCGRSGGDAAGAYADGPLGEVVERPVFESYVERLARGLTEGGEPGRPLTVAWDAGNGATGQVMTALAARLPGRHILLNEAIDGRFPAHHPDPTVEENLRLGAYQESSEAVTKERMQEIYHLFPRLLERRGQLAGTMSGGEQAMVSIGRGLMRAPKLLLIDEPSLGLSPLFVKENFNIIQKINERGITVFLVEQNVHQTLAISHFGFVLSKGRVAASGNPAELSAQPEVRDAYFG